MNTHVPTAWPGGEGAPVFDGHGMLELAQRITEPVRVVARRDGRMGLAAGGVTAPAPDGEVAVVGVLPALYPEWLGDRSFGRVHGVRFPYVAGEMARGISGTALVARMAEGEMLAFFGAGGLLPDEVERAVHEVRTHVGPRRNWGVNLLHTPVDTALEDRIADVLLRADVPMVSASAHLELTPAVVRCAASGLRRDREGRIVRRRAVFAKVSRLETAERFMLPAPAVLLRHLVEAGRLTEEEEALAAHVPVAEDVTVEGDSGGHTDGRPLLAVLPAVLALRERLAARRPVARPVRVGAAGGLGDPAAVAAAFALGAAYVVTGSVNQMAVEAGVCDDAKALLAQAGIADTALAPAADMFELGAQVQVLRRGTMFAGRAARLARMYRQYPSLEAIPAPEREKLEREVLGASVEAVWDWTRAYWTHRDTAEVGRAEKDPKHRMALVFQWYLGSSSRWAVTGNTTRRSDYQLWCSPAAGAFNEWTKGTFLAEPARRTVAQIALNLMQGAAVVTRIRQLRTHGVELPPHAGQYRPRPLR
ncbi:PfaD family polyunsaturated fatty acid/polyketide biosynthesis protein [Streptomyces sp. NPDC057116]|uniref:PfaD family polyunsaturated fatty acid/polyketide biosynthesis protein n=1 Tax=Streptomyces sp. NPDC057116 TaxID=3346023 RepID=UPI003642D674